MREPPVSRGLLQYLEETFPDRLPDTDSDISEREMWALMGHQRVIRHLRAIHKAQEEDALNGGPLR